MKIIFHPLFVAVLVISWIFGFGVFILALVGAVIVHELSHTVAAGFFGVRARELRLLPFGAEVNIDCAFLSADKKIIILLAGAFGNIIVSIVMGSLLWLFPNLFMFLEIFIAANAVPAILNLLPIYPLDGGKVIHIILHERFSRIFIFISNLFFCGLFVMSCLFFFNVPLLLLCIVMVISVNFELKTTKFVSKINVLGKAGKNPNGRVFETAVRSDMTLFQVYKLVHPRRYTKFILTDKSNKAFYEDELEQLLVNNSADKKISELSF